MRNVLMITGDRVTYYSNERVTDYAIYIVLAILVFIVATATVFATDGMLSLGLGIEAGTLVTLLAVNTVSLVMATSTEE